MEKKSNLVVFDSFYETNWKLAYRFLLLCSLIYIKAYTIYKYIYIQVPVYINTKQTSNFNVNLVRHAVQAYDSAGDGSPIYKESISFE